MHLIVSTICAHSTAIVNEKKYKLILPFWRVSLINSFITIKFKFKKNRNYKVMESKLPVKNFNFNMF